MDSSPAKGRRKQQYSDGAIYEPSRHKMTTSFQAWRVISALMNDPSAEAPGMTECPKGVVRSRRTDNGQTSPELPLFFLKRQIRAERYDYLG
ncbi:hypothetical protein AVEN_7891-1 [Araneus ventricosus]|uniref:Uncharacterized protein n=1 Tax=Araneus ventricosus TaxID=182803 RepID=A0A4Y2NXI1_ARAVE|nr:hypothetical protein AVEN_7891-1 [Araneus ventricosus]